MDCADQRHESHRTPPGPDQSSLAHDPSIPARADTDRITVALQNLHAAKATQFITDDPRTDRAGWGLQPAELDLWLGHGTNFISSLHIGKSPTNDSTRVYAQRKGWPVVVTTARDRVPVARLGQ